MLLHDLHPLFSLYECFLDSFFTLLESLNDSWDLRSKGAMDIGEMDSSVLSTANGNCRTPTPIMNLAGLTLYNGRKENSVPMSVPRPLLIDRKWTREGGKIERRYINLFFNILDFVTGETVLVNCPLGELNSMDLSLDRIELD